MIILLAVPAVPSKQTVRLGGVILTSTTGGNYANIMSVIGCNFTGFTKKQVVTSLTFTLYCIVSRLSRSRQRHSDKFSCPCTFKQANIIAPQTFLASEAPRYHTGILYTLVMMSAYIVLAWASWFVMLRENKRRDKLALTDPSYTRAHDNSDVLNGLRDLTDRQNGHFRYSG